MNENKQNKQNKQNKKNKLGKLIVLCGGEGSGKSSVLQALKELIPDVVISREPGGTPYAEDIRKNIVDHPLAKNANPETMFGQAWASRAEHMNHLIVPSLAKGFNVVVDRFDCCTYAYQLQAQGGEHLEDLFWHTRGVYLRDKVPDLYIFLDIDPEEGLKRVAGRVGEKSHFDLREMKFHEDVYRGYHSFFEKIQRISEDDFIAVEKSSFVIIDASRSSQEVRAEIVGIVANLTK